MPRRIPARRPARPLPPIVTILMLILTAPAAAQTLDLDPPPPVKMRIGYCKQGSNPSETWPWRQYYGAIHEFSFAGSVSQDLAALCRIPISSTKLNMSAPWRDIDGRSLGNVFLGLQTRPEPGSGWTTFGLFLPTGQDDDALFGGAVTDPTRPARFYPATFALYWDRSRRFEPSSWVTAQLSLGLQWDWLTSRDWNDNARVLQAHHGLALALGPGDTHFILEYRGLVAPSDNPYGLTGQYLHTLAFAVDWRMGKLAPAIFCRLPLDESLRRFTESSFGLRMDLELSGGD